MGLRIRLVLWYIFYCARIGARPWRYFQLNAPWFNSEKSLFSKLDMDPHIPSRWRLQQNLLAHCAIPTQWPVFLKPEWGQNSQGIRLCRNEQEFLSARKQLQNSVVPYLVQAAAEGAREFELFYIRDHKNPNQPAIFSCTETLNQSNDTWPINGIYNRATRYRDLSYELNGNKAVQLWQQINRLGNYRIARIGLRANSIQDMLEGNFKIIEINLFIPMPLTLLAENRSKLQSRHFLRQAMLALAKTTRDLPAGQKIHSIFWSMLLRKRERQIQPADTKNAPSTVKP